MSVSSPSTIKRSNTVPSISNESVKPIFSKLNTVKYKTFCKLNSDGSKSKLFNLFVIDSSVSSTNDKLFAENINGLEKMNETKANEQDGDEDAQTSHKELSDEDVLTH